MQNPSCERVAPPPPGQKAPAGQTAQAVPEPLGAWKPDRHTQPAAAVAPGAAASAPSAQSVQAEAPTVLEYVCTGHSSHAAIPVRGA